MQLVIAQEVQFDGVINIYPSTHARQRLVFKGALQVLQYVSKHPLQVSLPAFQTYVLSHCVQIMLQVKQLAIPLQVVAEP